MAGSLRKFPSDDREAVYCLPCLWYLTCLVLIKCCSLMNPALSSDSEFKQLLNVGKTHGVADRLVQWYSDKLTPSELFGCFFLFLRICISILWRSSHYFTLNIWNVVWENGTAHRQPIRTVAHSDWMWWNAFTPNTARIAWKSIA